MREETQEWTPEAMLQCLHDGVYYVDRERRIRYWNFAAERITGFSAEEVLGSCCADNILMHVDEAGMSLCTTRCPLAETMEDGQFREVEVFLHHKDGHRVPVSVRAAALRNDQGEIVGAVEAFTDLSNREATLLRVRELERLAMLDGLTQLANRQYVEEGLASRIEEASRYGIPFGVLFMDIDHFKEVNDRYGHEAGDAVLRTVAQTLAHNARPFDLVGRWGGEEFVVLLRNVDKAGLERIGERYRHLVAETLTRAGDETIKTTVSIGGTLLERDDTRESVIGRADGLMYRSKSEGRNRLSVG